MSAHELEELDMRIKALPQEMKDAIFEHYIKRLSEGPTTVIIDRTYKPPVHLQIDKKSRVHESKLYYQHPRVFLFYNQGSTFGLVKEWLHTLSASDRAALGNVELYGADMTEQAAFRWMRNQGQEVRGAVRAGVLRLKFPPTRTSRGARVGITCLEFSD